MPDDVRSEPLRYSAFISYSSHDRKFAAWLHRELESYRLPRRLPEGASLRDGRLKPLFHDTWELNAHHDLPQALREAIAQSESLIVICSRKAAQSDWVGREIQLFRTLRGRDAPIRAALIDGEPETSFHPALRGEADTQPVAADFRRGGSARKLAVLKLVAALAGVPLDELVQRDGQRRTRRVMAISGAAVATTLLVAVLSVVAITSREAAQVQRTRAESLNEALLTDVRANLKRSGRLDLLRTVNLAVDGYYRDQTDDSDVAQAQKAQLLQAMGEDDEKRGDYPRAQARFAEAHVITARQLSAQPDDAQRIFAHAQSAYYLGFIAWKTGDGAGARRGFQAYDDLARKLVTLQPANPDWQMEAAYAESNLGMLALRQAGDAREAERAFDSALARFQDVARAKPGDADVQLELSDGYAWLANARQRQGDLAGARAHRLAQQKILAALLVADPQNAAARTDMLANQLGLARLDAAQGRYAQALAGLDRGRSDAQVLLRATPDSHEVALQARAFELFKVRTQLAMPAAQRPATRALMATLGGCEAGGSGESDQEIAQFCQVLRARVLAAAGDGAEARRVLASVRARARGDALSARWGLDFAEEARLVGA